MRIGSRAQHRRGGAVTGAALTALLVATPEMPSLQSPDAPADVGVKAALLYNFVKFAEWPRLTGVAPLAACVVGDGMVADALVGIVRGKIVSGRTLDVMRPNDHTAWSGCHLLFIAGDELSRSGLGLTGIKELPVLTVSDGPGFARSGGIVEFYLDAGRMRFAINVDAVDRSGLHLSSHLLGLATVVRDHDVQ